MYSQGSFVASTNEAIRRYEGTKYVYVFDYISNYSISKWTDTNQDQFYGA